MAVRGAPDWSAVVDGYLSRIRDEVTQLDVNASETWALKASMWDATGSVRFKIIKNVLYAKVIRGHRHWAERASIARLLLLALKQEQEAGGIITNVDFVYVHNDRDPTPSGRLEKRLLLFTNAHNPARGGIPLPDFTWVGWRHAPSWCIQLSRMRSACRAKPWLRRDPRAFFSGNLKNGRERKELKDLVHKSAPAASRRLHVRDAEAGVNFRWAQFDASARRADGRRNESSLREAKSLPQEFVCEYQYALSLPGFGYSSRLRALLASGAVVVHVASADEEFYAPALKHGVHFVRLEHRRRRHAVRDQLMPELERLAADSNASRIMALAGQSFAEEWLSFDSVLLYVRTLLRAYSKLWRGPPVVSPDAAFSRIDDENDLPAAMKMCTCPDDWMGKPHEWPAAQSIRSCLRRFRGKDCRPYAGREGGRCWSPRCCVGFDCGNRPLNCSS